MAQVEAPSKTMRALSAIIACAAAFAAHAMPLSLLRMHDKHHRLMHPEVEFGPPAQFFAQTLDHFDHSPNTPTWKQRFWVNDEYCPQSNRASGCPIFLYVGGEGALNSGTAVLGEHCELAKQFGALLVSLEHRYYGASVPTSDLSTENLQWLSSQQALADLATFATWFRQQENLLDPTSSPLVTFGGSYPGALSSWARLKYPQIVQAAVSTSSPVQAKLDFDEYCQVVSDALSAPISGGSQQCLAATTAAFVTMNQALKEGGSALQQLSKELLSCTPLSNSPLDAFAAVSQWGGVIMGLVQYNHLILPPGDDSLNVAAFCNNMTSAPKGQELQTLVNTFAAYMDGECSQNTWNEQMVSLLNTTVDPNAAGVGIRQWSWQTASQFAYYQSCEAGCPFAPQMNLQGYVEQNFQAFNYTLDQTTAMVDFSLEYYGSNTTAADKTFFVNGGLDPWHVLSVQRPLPQFGDVRSLIINGTSHCRQMMPSGPFDPPQVVQARADVASAISEWLSEM
jgi:thymus-specific serine protease